MLNQLNTIWEIIWHKSQLPYQNFWGSKHFPPVKKHLMLYSSIMKSMWLGTDLATSAPRPVRHVTNKAQSLTSHKMEQQFTHQELSQLFSLMLEQPLSSSFIPSSFRNCSPNYLTLWHLVDYNIVFPSWMTPSAGTWMREKCYRDKSKVWWE